ncbi:MAG TPA: lysophospholipid acyltransferase family protein [Bryobacteraceae bacterium]|jgi:1-acyl-sn-glycerol-3-phosphate acyltransferase|nr:lysophospholipid acyltransferase family protein [Bryobacteraceae bacterium]
MSLSFLWAIIVKAPLIIGSTIFMGTISMITSVFDPDGRRQHAISRNWARQLLFFAGIRMRVRGLEHVRPGQHFVFAGNHLSLYDTPVVLACIPRQFLFLVNVKYVKLPFLGTHLKRSGHFAVDPDDTRASLRILTDAARRIQELGLSVLLFPEGRRSNAGLQDFKEGVAYIAIKSGAPVVPFALKGTREVLPIGSGHVRGGPVELLLGEPIDPTAYTLKQREEFTAILRERIAALMEQLDSETQPQREAA